MKFDHLMIIDDDEVVLFLAQLVINQYNKIGRLDSYTKADEALQDLLSGKIIKPDVILLDLNMPVMDGWEFLDTLQQYSLLNKIPIAILTSSIDPSDKKKSTNYKNVVEFISKPLSQDKLENLISNLRS